MPSPLPFEAEKPSKDFGKRLAEARKRRGWRQADVSKRTAFSRATIQKMEAGDPTVAFGSYLTLLSLYDAVQSVNDLCKAENDIGAYDRQSATERVRLKKDLDNDF